VGKVGESKDSKITPLLRLAKANDFLNDLRCAGCGCLRLALDTAEGNAALC
jgi:hypothetical protein